MHDGPSNDNTTHPKYQEYYMLICKQEVIGWDNRFRGKISKDWRILQHQYKLQQRPPQKPSPTDAQQPFTDSDPIFHPDSTQFNLYISPPVSPSPSPTTNPDNDQTKDQHGPTDPPTPGEQQTTKTKKKPKRKINCFQQFMTTLVSAVREEL